MEGFHRYTHLASLLHTLSTRTLTLLNPATWDDRNDAYFMSEYKRHLGATSVLALCFAEDQQTYHHWRVFAHGPNGVCITFNKDSITEHFHKQPMICQGSVQYKSVFDVNGKNPPTASSLPFLKRTPYEAESEYRIIYTDYHDTLETKSFSIDCGWIERVTLSPWLPNTLRTTIENVVRSIYGCRNIDIQQSRIIDSEHWKSAASNATKDDRVAT